MLVELRQLWAASDAPDFAKQRRRPSSEGARRRRQHADLRLDNAAQPLLAAVRGLLAVLRAQVDDLCER